MYQRYEDGRIPRSDILSDIASRCGVSVEQLLSGNTPPPQETVAFWQAKAASLEAKLDNVNEAMALILEGVKRLQKAMATQ